MNLAPHLRIWNKNSYEQMKYIQAHPKKLLSFELIKNLEKRVQTKITIIFITKCEKMALPTSVCSSKTAFNSKVFKYEVSSTS